MSTGVIAERQLTYEEERGKPVPNFNHARVQGRLFLQLSQQDRYDVCPELTIQPNPAVDRMTPDLCLLPHKPSDWSDRAPVETRVPLLVVEIQSPTQSFDDMLAKARDYIHLGVKTVWVVIPALCSLAVVTGDGRPAQHTRGTLHDPHSGAAVDLDVVFA